MRSSLLTLTRNIAPIALLFAFSACGDSTTQSGPGGLTPDDARALDEAAAKLDAKALPPPAPLQTIQAQPASGPGGQPAEQADKQAKPVKK
jgi:hypothetical protein